MRADGHSPRLLEAFCAAALALGCSVATGEDAEVSAEGVTHALVAVERSALANSPEAAKADAFASFLRLPSNVQPNALLPIANFAASLPEPGACKRMDHDQRPLPGLELTRVELLDAGEVTLVAGGTATILAPRAFPNVTDSISGVVYTTRDRAAEPLPAAARYALATTGSSALGPISIDLPAPEALATVSLAGTPLGEVETLPTDRALELSWKSGAPTDRVYVALESGMAVSVCTFRDDAGRGTLPVSALPATGAAELSVHRLRATPFTDVGLARGELRFDFELSRPILFE